MTKADLIEEVSRLAELTRKDSEIIVETIFDSVVRSLRAGDKIEIRGQEDSLFQAQQGAEGRHQPRRRGCGGFRSTGWSVRRKALTANQPAMPMAASIRPV